MTEDLDAGEVERIVGVALEAAGDYGDMTIKFNHNRWLLFLRTSSREIARIEAKTFFGCLRGLRSMLEEPRR